MEARAGGGVGLGTQPRGWEGRQASTDLIKGDFFIVPILNVEQHDHSAVFVPTGEDTRVASLNGAADGLQGQAVEELGVLQPEVHVAWRRQPEEPAQGASPPTHPGVAHAGNSETCV